MEKYIYKGKNKEELLKTAMEELKVTEDEITYKETEEKSGLFSGKKYVLEIVKIEDIANMGKDLLTQLLKAFNIEGNIEKKIRGTQISYHIHSNNNGILIGKNGKILTAIQNFVKQSINSKLGIHVNIIIDIEDYKEKQNYFLEKSQGGQYEREKKKMSEFSLMCIIDTGHDADDRENGKGSDRIDNGC